MSDMEIIYDNNVATEKLKSGAKYERLTAIVYKILENNNTVIHDLRLRGDGKTASHQIDVTVQKGNTKKKILIECKDYDAKIGIGIIRDFFGAVNQIKPDEAYVVTTVGFTKGAVAFASDEGIKLYILRDVLEDDLDGRILKINLHLIIPSYDFEVTELLIDNEAEIEKLANYRNQKVMVGNLPINDPQGMKISSLFAKIDEIVKGYKDGKDKNLIEKLIVKPNYIDFNGVKIDGVIIRIKITHDIIKNTIEPKGIATLILQSLDGTIDKIIQNTDITKWTFDDEGKVVNKNS